MVCTHCRHSSFPPFFLTLGILLTIAIYYRYLSLSYLCDCPTFVGDDSNSCFSMVQWADPSIPWKYTMLMQGGQHPEHFPEFRRGYNSTSVQTCFCIPMPCCYYCTNSERTLKNLVLGGPKDTDMRKSLRTLMWGGLQRWWCEGALRTLMWGDSGKVCSEDSEVRRQWGHCCKGALRTLMWEDTDVRKLWWPCCEWVSVDPNVRGLGVQRTLM